MNENVKLIAFYLPQFYPVKINDELYGKGFTEWRNVAKMRPLFPGHYQPHIPADLGFYDLRLPETKEAQAKLAREYGVDGFCYWHYWLGNGIEFLEKPVQDIINSGKPDFPFCLAWANHDWKANSFLSKNRKILIKQEYPGTEDYKNHFYSVLPCLKDKRYIKIDGKPVFMIYQPMANPDIPNFIKLWRELAVKEGLPGIFFIGHLNNDIRGYKKEDIFSTGVDAVNEEFYFSFYNYHNPFIYRAIKKLFRMIFKLPQIVTYKKASKYFLTDDCKEEYVFPSVIPNWDNTPRRKDCGVTFTHSTPALFEKHFEDACNRIRNKDKEHQVIFLKSWNEWAEGNYVEPDMKYGLGFLEAIHRVKSK